MAAPPTSSPPTDTAFWEGLWSADGGLAPGTRFDRETPSPALVDALERRSVLPGRLGGGGDGGGAPLRALVPGCGRGYDVVLLGKSGLFPGGVTGLDVAPTGAAAAAKYVAEAGVPAGVGVECADFFEFKGVAGGYDLIYDYTFFCALPLELRPAWAATMARLLSPAGELVTLIYPIDASRAGGPPFASSREALAAVLGPAGLACVEYRPLPSALCHPGRDGANGTSASAWARWARVAPAGGEEQGADDAAADAE